MFTASLLSRWRLQNFLRTGALLALPAAATAAGVTKEATITQKFNDVRTLEGAEQERPAVVGETIREKQGVRTAAQARAELRFRDNALLRLGASTVFTFDAGANEYDVKQGTMFIQAPKGGGTKVRTAAVTAAIVGTSVLLEFTPDFNPPPGSTQPKRKGYVKVIVLEGNVRLYINNRVGESVLLGPGQMMITSPSATKLPTPVTVDIARVAATSLLVNNANWRGAAGITGNAVSIRAEADRQQTRMAAGTLQKTNLGIYGRGTNVVLGSAAYGPDAFQAIQNRSESVVATAGEAVPAKFGPAFLNAGAYQVIAGATVVTDPTIDSAGRRAFGTIYQRSPSQSFAAYVFGAGRSPFDDQGSLAGFDRHVTDLHSPITVFRFGSLTISGTPVFDLSTGPANVAFVAQTSLTIGGGASVSLGPLNFAVFATENGRMEVSAGTTLDATATELLMHARGTDGTLTLAGTVNAGTGLAVLGAEQNLVVSGRFTGGQATLFAGRDIDLSAGMISADAASLTAGGNLTLRQGSFDFGRPLSLMVTTRTLTLASSVVFPGPASAQISVGDGGIVGTGFTISGSNLQLTLGGGTITAAALDALSLQFTAATNVNLGTGPFTARSAVDLRGGTLTAGAASVAGSLSVGSANLDQLTLTGTNPLLTSTSNVVVTAFSTPGSVNVGGSLFPPSNLTTVDNSRSILTIGGNLTVGGSTFEVNGTPFNYTAINVAGNIDVGAFTPGNFLGIEGTVTAGGTIRAGSMSVNSATAGGAITVAGSLSVGTFLQAPSLTAQFLRASDSFVNGVAMGTGPKLVNISGPIALSMDIARANSQSFPQSMTITTLSSLVVGRAVVLRGFNGFFDAVNPGNSSPATLNLDVTINANSFLLATTAALLGPNGGQNFILGIGPALAQNQGAVDAPRGSLVTLNIASGFSLAPAGRTGFVDLRGGSAFLSGTGRGGDGGSFAVNSAGPISFVGPSAAQPFQILADSGETSVGAQFGGAGGSVSLASTADTVTLTNASVVVSSTQASGTAVTPGRVSTSRSGGTINVSSGRAAGVAISISDTSQLRALLEAAAPGLGGRVQLVATGAGSGIRVGGTVQADRGTVEIRHDGANGTINLTGTASVPTTVRADLVKIGAVGANGVLTVGAGTISGDSIIKLYGGTATGGVVFAENVTLSGNSVKTIAGRAVTINNGRVVTVAGPAPAQVFTNTPNYTGSGGNGSTTGVFGGQGATTQPLSAAPGF